MRPIVPSCRHWRDADLAFVIDPVDGTFNFASGMPVFGTILAVTVKGETVAGIIHDPALGDTVVSLKGAGAFQHKRNCDPVRLKVAEPIELNRMIGAMSCSHMEEPDRSRVAANMARIKMTFAFNCSAYEYWMVSSGKLHFTRSSEADAVGSSGRRADASGGRRPYRQIRRNALQAGRDFRRHHLGSRQGKLADDPKRDRRLPINRKEPP